MATITTMTVPGARALAELARLRAEAPKAGRYPVLLGSPRDYDRIQEAMESKAFDPAELLAEAGELDAAELLAELRNDSFRPDGPGEWPDELDEDDESQGEQHLSAAHWAEVVVGLFPVEAPWQVFAHLNWGWFNDCPGAAEHCAVQRSWAERYGAEVVAVTGDVVECTVARPPQGRAAALELAWEQYAYNPDLVDQGTGTVARLAAGLLGERVWYFWWD